ncbi:TonB family protein [Sphingomonas lacunae]|uniref:TonB family protein n=1 Tax=Sphingomonas lacunae TaxID=2698828 RepID=A0A6M4ATQ3_9SPHN|nr:TonB family protein [Sphingomonas lacunae]QJQ32445.1 TonB family protein [Sphingomonas lacunae]
MDIALAIGRSWGTETLDWQEFSFSLNGQSHHVYSREEAETLIRNGVLLPETPVTLFLASGKRRRTTAQTLDLGFAPPPPVQQAPTSPMQVQAPSPKPLPPVTDAEPVPPPPAAATLPKTAKKTAPPVSSRPPAEGGGANARSTNGPQPADPLSPTPPVPTGFVIFLVIILAIAVIWLWNDAPVEEAATGTDPVTATTSTPTPDEAGPAPASAPVDQAPVPAVNPKAAPEPAPRDIPRACRSWSEQPRELELCSAVQWRYRRLQVAFARAAIGGESPETTLRLAINSCSSRSCVEQRIDARIADLTRPAPVAAPPPAAILEPAIVDRSREAAPRGNPARWVSTSDYPASALRAGTEGTTHINLTIGPEGRVTRCDITQSSGDAALDGAACAALQRRARFTPALDRDGNPSTGSYTTRIRWQIPR